MRILVLGHNGLLGNMVYSYYKSKNYNVITTNFRWPSLDFMNFVSKQEVDVIINCIGMIPQKKPNDILYSVVNYQLPVWLDNLGIKIIHPDTDESDDTPYGLSKKMAKESITKNTKIIKTSIIGFEKNTKFSFLDWFLNSEMEVSGFINQFWNGNTTYEWAKWSEELILNWYKFDNVTILSNPDCLSKYDILLGIKDIFNKDIIIKPVESLSGKNNCLQGDYITKNIFEQIEDMKSFYNKYSYKC